MIISAIVHRGRINEKYNVLDYVAAMFLCLGAAGYAYRSESTNNGNQRTSWYGIVLLMISTTCDALLPNLQQILMMSSSDGNNDGPSSISSRKTILYGNEDNKEQLLNQYKGLSAATVMVNTNAVGFLSLFFYMIFSGSLMSFIVVALANPHLMLYLTCVGLSLSTAVLAYTKLIKTRGSVTAVTVATIRKIVTVMLSYIIFPKPLSHIHVYSLLLVLVGVGLAAITRQNHRSNRN